MRHPLSRFVSLSLLALAVNACSDGGGGGGVEGFQLIRISVLEGDVWKVNREIVFTFSDDVDFSTVSLNTINIQTLVGEPATGSFTLRGTDQVVFQPNCPTLPDLSDSGLKAGNVAYQIRVVGQSSGTANSVRSTSGEALRVTQVRNFTTPTTAVNDAFQDTVAGPPTPIIRSQGSGVLAATRVVTPTETVYFERDAMQNLVLSDPAFLLPLNLYSRSTSRVAFIVEFNQALSPAPGNVGPNRLRLEFQDNGGTWIPMETRVTLTANCTATGASVRLEPIGVLPQDRVVRAVILGGLEDLVGESDGQVIDNFAIVGSQPVNFVSLTPVDSQSDEYLEDFDLGGTSSASFEDTDALFASPRASWDDGMLTAAFDFEGTGGPGGAFDWLVNDGDSILVDTDVGSILAADGVTLQTTSGGEIDVRNMTIEEGGTVRVQGSNPLRINATGKVVIRGTLDVSGFNARNVVLPNRGDVLEPGGAGGPGGGRGGNANETQTNSTARGGSGQGPGTAPDSGGQGGETAFAPDTLGREARRPGGGAGGRFARNQGAGLTAGAGLGGHPLSTGAQAPTPAPAVGGQLRPGPFVDASTNNDFFGFRAVDGGGGTVSSLIRGELGGLSAGYGGGGGGNADPASTFPTPNWTPASDEKGGAGGGGGGGLHIRALGAIQFGAAGQILSDGGQGGLGENVLVQDHIGGSGGSGSGGHIVLETATFLDFTDEGAAGATPARDWVRAVGGPQIVGPTAGVTANVSYGGAGGPGVIQFHVPDSLAAPGQNQLATDIVVPAGLSSVDQVSSPPANVLVPSFGTVSKARSRWVSLGDASENSTGFPSLVQFLFQGIETAVGPDEGKILVTGDQVTELTPLLDEDLEGNPNVSVLGDRLTLRVTGSSLDPLTMGTTAGISNDIYLRSASLLEGFVLRLSVATEMQNFNVSAGSYDDAASRLDITVADEGTDLQDFINANTALGTIHYELVPRFFRVLTGGTEKLPTDAFVRILFQGTQDDGTGNPDEGAPLVDWTADISQFNAQPAGQLQFFRFEVEFDLATLGSPTADTEAVALDFLRIPFVF